MLARVWGTDSIRVGTQSRDLLGRSHHRRNGNFSSCLPTYTKRPGSTVRDSERAQEWLLGWMEREGLDCWMMAALRRDMSALFSSSL
jgi:hypothetical protein